MMDSNDGFLAGIDAGGTTFKCGLATLDGNLVAQHRVATTKPEETLQACAAFLRDESTNRGGRLLALGIAAFGPVDVDPLSATYGKILDTPKAGWTNTDLRDAFTRHLSVPVCVDTDVNAALLAEMASGAARHAVSSAYVTIGTGIGAGICTPGGLAGKPKHPEFGHIRVQRHPADNAFRGVCVFHRDCLEGVASAPAFTARHGDPESLDVNHPGWDIEAYYLAQACLTLSLSFRLERIILGGGLMLAPNLLALVHRHYLELSGGYLGETIEEVEQLIALPGHGADAGLMGGLHLAAGLLQG